MTPEAAPPQALRHDAVTMACPICGSRFTPSGRRRFCSDACRAAAYRRRRNAGGALTVPLARPRRPFTVYECQDCGTRVGEQRCGDCSTFMRKIGIGGECPCCNEPVAISELVAEEGIGVG